MKNLHAAYKNLLHLNFELFSSICLTQMMHIYKIIAQPMKKIQQRHALYRILCFLSEQENFQQTFGEWHFGGRRWLEAIQSGK